MPDSQITDPNQSSERRAELLREAARNVDAQSSHLGPGDPNLPPTREGDVLRALTEDQASLAAEPEVYCLTSHEARDKLGTTPVRFAEFVRDHRFFLVRFPIGLAPRREWAFSCLDFRAEFNPGALPEQRPRTQAALPTRKFQELLRVTTQAEVTINGKFEFEAKQPVANAKADGKTAAKLSAGPFNYRFTRAEIEQSGTGLEWIQWRLDGGKFFEENRPDLLAIVKVPRQATEFRISAALAVRRNLRLLTGPMWKVITSLKEGLRAFLQDGAPLHDVKQYNLDAHLADD